MSALGHHQHLVRALAARAARPLSFLSGNYRDQELWRGYARKKIFELLHYAPPRIPFSEEILEEQSRGSYSIRKLWFSASQYSRVPAYLLMPRLRQGKLPGLLCLHDHGGLFAWGKEKLVPSAADNSPALAAHKERFYSGLSVAHEFATAGFAVLVPDAFYFGDRRLVGSQELDGVDLSTLEGHARFEEIAAKNEPLVALSVIQAGATLMGVGIWDAIRAVEFLTTVDGVDARRIGCFGAFSGGLMAVFLSGLCDLIRASCAAGWVTTFASVVECGVSGCGWCHYAVPGLYNFLDLPDIACLSIPRALFLMSFEGDPLFGGSRASFANVRKVYEMAECGDGFLSQTYPGPPRFTRQNLGDALRWFQRWL